MPASLNPLIGQIIMFAGNFAPRGWALCDGQIIAISQNTALFSILGTTYGGDGRTTFGLPDIRGRFPMHAGNGPGLTPRKLGQKFGIETNTMNTLQMPSHNHSIGGEVSVTVADDDGNAFAANGNALAKRALDVQTSGAIEIYRSSPTFSDGNKLGGVTNTLQVGLDGGNAAFNNLMPTQCVNYIIALLGRFPSRN